MGVRFGDGFFVRTFVRGSAKLEVVVDVPTAANGFSDRVSVWVHAPTLAEARGAMRRWRGTLAGMGVRSDALVQEYHADPPPLVCCEGLTFGIRCERCVTRAPYRPWASLHVEA